MGAPAFIAATGITGAGIKLGVIDDGVDHLNPFFNPAGYAYPAGFPKGQTGFTTPKVIAARSFPVGRRRARKAPTRPARVLPRDARREDCRGQQRDDLSGRAGSYNPRLSGVAPRAWIGSYRVFTVPTRLGHIADTPEIVAALEGSRPRRDERRQLLRRRSRNGAAHRRGGPCGQNTANAGVVPVISAGNDRDDFGFGSVGSPGTTPDAITVAATTNTHVFAPALSVRDAGAPPRCARSRSRPPAVRRRADGARPTGSWSTSALQGTNGQPVDSRVCGLGRDRTSAGIPPRGSLAGAIALITRGHCTFFSKAVPRSRQAPRVSS